MLCIGAAGAFCLASTVTSWNAKCPYGGSFPTGLDKGISLVPPGATCYSESGRSYMYEAHPWMWNLSQLLVVCALVVLVLSVIAAAVNARGPNRV